MKIDVMDTWAVMVKDDTLQQNSPKTYWVEFNFDKSWDGYSRTVIFEAGSANVVVVLKEYSDEENRCPIPKECLKYGGVKLKIGIYGVKGEEHKAIVGYLASTIIPDGGMNLGGSSSGTLIPDEVYSEIMAAIGDLSAAGFEGKTLAEVLSEIKNSVCGTATDEEVDEVLDNAFGQKPDLPDNPGGDESPDNTATDKEVDEILNEVFGKQP